MLTNSWRRFWAQAAWGLALVLLAPAFAQAQHTGLFPLRSIRRERVPCPNEDPVYRLYRQQYFGYHPTCWRRFPKDWGCPSPEAPDPAASYAKYPRGEAPPTGTGGSETEPGPDQMPLAPDAGMAPDRGTRPGPTELPALPRENGSLFDQRPGQNSPAPAAPPTDRPVPPPGASNGVRPLDSPAEIAGNPAQGSPASDPLLALPDASASTVPDPSMATAPAGDQAASSGFPEQAPQRRSVIGGLFNRLGLRRR